MSDSPLFRISSEIDFSVAGDAASIGELSEEWRSLAVSAGNAFLTPEWYDLSRQRSSGAPQPILATARQNGRLLGIMPMLAGPGRTDPVGFAGTRLGDRFGPLLAGDAPPEVARALYGTVLEAAEGRPVVLTRVPADEGWWADAQTRSSLTAPAGEWPVADLGSKGWEGYLASRSRNLRSQVRRRLRALQGAHEVEIWRASSPRDVELGMEELFRLHAARWRERAERSVFDRPEAHAFHREFARAAAERGWLRLFLLKADGQSVAAWYGWRLGATVSYYQAGYDPDWAAKSVGSVLFGETIRLAAEEGAERYDMLLGDEAFKLRYATKIIDAVDVTAARRWSHARLRAVALARLKPVWRSLPAGLRTRMRRG